MTGMWKCVCGQGPCDGLDCGVYLPGCAPRKKAAPKTAAENAEIRARAWATRRFVAALQSVTPEAK
jgi:hypothetical protein